MNRTDLESITHEKREKNEFEAKEGEKKNSRHIARAAKNRRKKHRMKLSFFFFSSMKQHKKNVFDLV